MVAEEPILAIGFVMIGVFYYAHSIREDDEAMSEILKAVGLVTSWFIMAVSGVDYRISVFYFLFTLVFLCAHLILRLLKTSLLDLIKEGGRKKKGWSDDV
jgi:hypothetical protein